MILHLNDLSKTKSASSHSRNFIVAGKDVKSWLVMYKSLGKTSYPSFPMTTKGEPSESIFASILQMPLVAVGKTVEERRSQQLRSSKLNQGGPGQLWLIYHSKHLDSHIKPHRCREPGCTFGAAKTRDLKRHVLSHGLVDGAKVYYCPSNGCNYSRGGKKPPFGRMDNAKRHTKDIHNGCAKPIPEIYSRSST
jgi:hypothetical protein